MVARTVLRPRVVRQFERLRARMAEAADARVDALPDVTRASAVRAYGRRTATGAVVTAEKEVAGGAWR